jgi:hypothetical protein
VELRNSNHKSKGKTLILAFTRVEWLD